MKESKIARELQGSINFIEKQIYTFLATKSNPYLTLPPLLQKQSNLRQVIAVRYVVVMLSQVRVEGRVKQLIIELLIDILQNSRRSINNIVKVYDTKQFEESGQLMGSIRKETRLINILSRVVSLPASILNLINDPKINMNSYSIKQLQKLKKVLNNEVLRASAQLPNQQRLIIINKLLILKQQQQVVNFLINADPIFLHQNFSNLSKQSNIIRYLYKAYISQEGEKKLEYRNELSKLANSDANPQYFSSLLNLDQVEYYSGQRYKEYYYLFYESGLKESIVKDLLYWWAVAKNYIIPSVHAKVRCNILAIITKNMSKQQLYQSNYLLSLTQGIKKRLTDGTSKEFAALIWKAVGQKLEIKLTDEIEKAKQFQIQDQKPIVLHSQPEVSDELSIRIAPIAQIQLPSSQPAKDKEQSSDEKVQTEGENEDSNEVIKIQPKNIYDCILCLRNQNRFEVGLRKLPELIKKYKQDLALMWNTLLRQLLSPLKEPFVPILAQLFNLKPEQFIESVVMYFMPRQNNISEKIYLMDIIKLATDALSTSQAEEDQPDQQFYFKKVKSRYFKEPQSTMANNPASKRQQRSRRWGHTRIAYQKANKGIHLNFLKDQVSINRFYPIANLLYFKIIDPWTVNIIQNLRAHQVYVHSLLRLLAHFISNIQNHFDKYLIISDASAICLKIVSQLQANIQKTNDRYEQTGGLTLMLTLQVLNKASLILDKYVSEGIMEKMKVAIEGSKKLPNYGMSGVISMIQANIYHRMYGNNGQ